MTFHQQVKSLVCESQLFAAIEHELDEDEELHWDSMSLIWFITSLEERFGLSIDYRIVSLDHFKTVRSISRFIEMERKGVSL